jgi:hypothetical protein
MAHLPGVTSMIVNARKRVRLAAIGNEVDAPGLIRCGSYEPVLPVPYCFPLALWPVLQGQTLFFVQPVHQILAYIPALAVSSTQISRILFRNSVHSSRWLW